MLAPCLRCVAKVFLVLPLHFSVTSKDFVMLPSCSLCFINGCAMSPSNFKGIAEDLFYKDFGSLSCLFWFFMVFLGCCWRYV